MAMGLCLEVDWNESQCLWRRSEFLGQLEQIFVDWCLWRIGACGSMLVNVRERGRGDFKQEGERERQVSSMEAAVSLRMERKREFSDGF